MLLIVIGLLSYVSLVRFRADAGMLDHTRQVLTGLEERTPPEPKRVRGGADGFFDAGNVRVAIGVPDPEDAAGIAGVIDVGIRDCVGSGVSRPVRDSRDSDEAGEYEGNADGASGSVRETGGEREGVRVMA